MPVITVTMATGQTSREQKEQLIEQLTARAVEITSIPRQAFTVLIQELEPTAIGIGGQTLERMWQSD